MPAITRTTEQSRKFADLHCDSVGYEFGVSVDKFDLVTFSKSFQFKEPLKPGISFEATLSTRNPKLVDFHVHLHWKLTKRQIKLRIVYAQKAMEAEQDEEEPFAESAMRWLGTFFKAKDSSAHFHAAFEYPAEKWALAIPLPIKIPVGSRPEVEVDGMSLNLSGNATGISQAWLISREKISRVLLYGDRLADFSTFDVIKEVEMLSVFAKDFLKEVPNATDKL